MKSTLYSILIATSFLFMFFGCDKNNQSNITGELTDNSECKALKADFSDTVSCINYIFEASTNTLNLSHINASFNCCPGNLSCEISIENDTIIIQEFASKQDCNCMCLFDLEIELKRVSSKKYFIKIVEPYIGDQQEILFEVDFTENYEGSYCVTRTQYPWGINL
jgi:hypothetical protein